MSESSGNSPSSRSWRDIPQEVQPRAMSKTGRRRQLLALAKVICGTAIMAGLAWACIELVSTIENNPRQLARAAQSGPVKDIVPVSDGVLDKQWVIRTLGLSKSDTLMELDLDKLQARLLASGQVKSAMIMKSFPSTLAVTLSERVPVARIMVQDASQEPSQYLVARDGVIFKGEGYDPALCDSLPWLDGVRLSRNGGSIAPIEGMAVVSELLAKAKYETEHLYSLFKVVNLARLQSDGEIEVKAPECESVIFSTKEDFFKQLAWLDYIRDMVKPTPESPLARIDLSHGAGDFGQGSNVPVAFPKLAPQPARKAGSAPAPSVTPAEPAQKKTSPAFFNFQTKPANREL
ncbi:MAG: FtsQ-type POTRA domain-containing protein [Opitutaceae bacterium]|jgi:cell division protein FtsQ